MLKTRVVNLRKEPYDVYIGREGRGFDGTFGNPFWNGNEDEREYTLYKFKEYFFERIVNDEEFRRKVETLRGRRLGCFCVPKACHGQVIADYLDGSSDAVPSTETREDTGPAPDTEEED